MASPTAAQVPAQLTYTAGRRLASEDLRTLAAKGERQTFAEQATKTWNDRCTLNLPT